MVVSSTDSRAGKKPGSVRGFCPLAGHPTLSPHTTCVRAQRGEAGTGCQQDDTIPQVLAWGRRMAAPARLCAPPHSRGTRTACAPRPRVHNGGGHTHGRRSARMRTRVRAVHPHTDPHLPMANTHGQAPRLWPAHQPPTCRSGVRAGSTSRQTLWYFATLNCGLAPRPWACAPRRTDVMKDPMSR